MKKVTKKFNDFQEACEALANPMQDEFDETFGIDGDFGHSKYSKTTITTKDIGTGTDETIVEIEYE